MTKKRSNRKKRASGRKPERLRIESDWRDAAARAIRKKKPPEGWPDEPDSEKKG